MTPLQPSTEQQAASTTDLQNSLILAPPGCGKTEVLAYRANYLVDMLGPNQRILALTFTNRARANLRDRLRNVLGVERTRRYVTARNFHGHAAEIVLSHHKTVGLDLSTYIPPTTRTLAKALHEVTTDATISRDAANLLGEVKRSALNDQEVLEALASAINRVGMSAAISVEERRQAANVLHYDDLLRHAQRLLTIAGVANLYQCHYGAVLVDEFQDLSLQQLDIVNKTCSTSRTFAGDPLQGIYSWAGAEPEKVEQVLNAVCPEPIRLSESYRSSPRVLELVNSFGTQLGSTALKSARPDRWPDAGFATAVVFRDYADEAGQVVSGASLLFDRDPTLSIGIITRSKWRRREIDERVASSGLPMRRWDLAVDDPRILQLMRVSMAQLPRGVGFEEARTGVLETIDAADVDTIEQVGEVFAHLIDSGVSTPRAALRSLRSSGDPTQVISPGIHLLNAHTSKGQQFDWVFVVGLEERHIPDSRNSGGLALSEEMRVLLVMLARARHGLVVTSVDTLSGRYGPYASTRSRWFAALDAAKPCNWIYFPNHVDAVYPISSARNSVHSCNSLSEAENNSD